MALACTVLPAPRPIGALTVGVTADGLALVAFGNAPEAARRAADRLGEPLVEDSAGTAAAVEQLGAYLTGARRTFDLPLDWRLTAGSQRRVLQTLFETVPFGAGVTYGRLAARSGLGGAHTAARGVGSIMGSNPLPVVVPCHRVLAADGLGGFGGGRAVKEWLLAHEGLLTPALDLWADD
ncbi:methylated-DNA--[protein]-cysteine S-methyltransferase [Pseudonocardia nigra]|uniref:methylated-DNA--[protein]-cysteine S-methyltransferase n=1 Tax=Pseudonocardia nigra TaxID=1921578 RepID=UPI001C5F24E4|nr:methylated-DNA--[protein]-cysteine S-methyltransferase [Pseudonocardia nigra]